MNEYNTEKFSGLMSVPPDKVQSFHSQPQQKKPESPTKDKETTVNP